MRIRRCAFASRDDSMGIAHDRLETMPAYENLRGGSPDEVTGVSIKVGHPFNPTNARGRVEVDDLRID
mgnify:CR=1 FL=1